MSAVPPSFTPQTSFSTLAQQPILSTGLPGSELDGEFSRASDSINQIKSRLSEVQRDDGKLRNAVVSTESLSSDVVDLIALGGTVPITWAIGIQINVGDLVSNPPGTAGTYLCIVAHTSSSVFANDLAKWALIAAPPTVGVLYTNTFTGNGSTTAFTLTQTPASKDNTQLYINGVYQQKSSYSIDNVTLTITPAPAAAAVIEISIGVPSNTNIVTVADGAISTSKLDTNAVTTVKIAGLAVTEAKIADTAITTAKIVNNAITTAKINNSAVTNEKINQFAVTSDKIADESVSTSKLTALSVVGDKIASNTISTAKLQDNAVTTAKIADSTITNAKILDGTIAEAKIADNAIATTKINDNAVTTSKLASSSVTTAKIANAAVTPEKLSDPYTLEAVQSSTSGTAIDFTGIPSWVKCIRVILNGVSTNGSDNLIIQLGDTDGIENTGYISEVSNRGGDATSTAGLIITKSSSSSSTCYGIVTICKCTGNTWVYSANISITSLVNSSAGSKTLSGTLDRIRLTGGGANIFDGGQVNISYE